MPHAIGGGGRQSGPTYKTESGKLTKALVVEDVQIITKNIEVPIYKLVDVPREQVKYETKIEEQTRYTTKEESTTKYIPKEEITTKYNVVEEATTKYVPKEVSVERPVPVPKEYERPVIKETIVELVSYSDTVAIKSFIELMPQLLEETRKLKKELDELRRYKLVEQVIKVPKIEWVTTPVERIIWKDVERIKEDVDKG